jgi:hypothetical protein
VTILARALSRTCGTTVDVPPDAEVPWLVVDHAVDSLIAACAPRPARVEVVALAPAAWVCGPSGAGPVDAVRFGGSRTRDIVHTRLFSVQHTRCWVLSCVFLGHSLRLPLPELPSVLATDTAKITQYMEDRGLGDQWPGVVLGAVDRDDGGIRFTALCTESDIAEELTSRAVSGPAS